MKTKNAKVLNQLIDDFGLIVMGSGDTDKNIGIDGEDKISDVSPF